MEIAFNSYSLRKEWASLTDNFTNFDPIVKFIKTMEGVTQVELLDRTFKSDPSVLRKIQKVFGANGLKIFSLGPHISPLVGQGAREATRKEFRHWIDLCGDHGIPNFRVSLGGGKNFEKKKLGGFIPIGQIKPKSVEEAVEWSLDVLKPSVAYAEERGVTLAIETHHRYSSNPQYQAQLLDALPSSSLGFIFDIGNYESRDLCWESLEVLLKKKAIKYMHAKTYAFDEQGMETTLDYPRAIRQMMEAGLKIPLSIEWEGRMPTVYGIYHTYELCKYSLAKAKGESYSMNLSWPPHDEILENLKR